MDDKHATVKAQVPEGLAALATNGAAGGGGPTGKTAEEIRVELAETKAEMIKWTLVMWIGQFAALAGVMSFLLRPH